MVSIPCQQKFQMCGLHKVLPKVQVEQGKESKRFVAVSQFSHIGAPFGRLEMVGSYLGDRTLESRSSGAKFVGSLPIILCY